MEKHTPYDENMTVAHMEQWLKVSRPGDSIEYHRGFLALDRETVTMMPQGFYAHVFHEPYHDIGLIAYGEYERGTVNLVQQKIAPGRYRYIAIKRKGAKNGKRSPIHLFHQPPGGAPRLGVPELVS